jgi:predicted transposase YdaD
MLPSDSFFARRFAMLVLPLPPESVNNPHDAYAQRVFCEIPQARGFFRSYLPEDVRSLFDWRTLRLESATFVSDELGRQFADLRFSIRLVGDTIARRITLLFEHKQRVVYTTARQLHRYISRQLESTPDHEPLPSILTVVLLQSGTWKRPCRLSSEYALPEPAREILAPYLVDFQMVMVELASLDENGLRGTVAGRLALALLKSVGEGQPMGWLRFRSILSEICGKLSPQGLRRELRRALYYLLSVTEKDQEAEVRQSLQTIQDEFLPVKENIMTLLEHLKKSGEKRGEKRGKERGQRLGKANTLVRLLSAAFPEFSTADADRVRELPDGTLDELTDAIAVRRSWTEIESIVRRPNPA